MAAVFFGVFATGVAFAELTARGNLFVSFQGGIAPAALPRDSVAPIAIRIGGRVRTLSGERPPALREISIELNRGGQLDFYGLPVCRLRELEASSGQQALDACGSALVGGGNYVAKTAFPEQEAFPAQGRVLAFNAVVEGHHAILAHVYSADPLPITRIIVFRIRNTVGTYGTVLTGELPVSVNRYGYVKSINLRLHRRYFYRGKERSYVVAGCPAPKGFPGAAFSFAHASMTFADGRTLGSTLTRSCRVRG